jgi:hypothetical protein
METVFAYVTDFRNITRYPQTVVSCEPVGEVQEQE